MVELFSYFKKAPSPKETTLREARAIKPKVPEKPLDGLKRQSETLAQKFSVSADFYATTATRLELDLAVETEPRNRSTIKQLISLADTQRERASALSRHHDTAVLTESEADYREALVPTSELEREFAFGRKLFDREFTELLTKLQPVNGSAETLARLSKEKANTNLLRDLHEKIDQNDTAFTFFEMNYRRQRKTSDHPELVDREHLLDYETVAEKLNRFVEEINRLADSVEAPDMPEFSWQKELYPEKQYHDYLTKLSLHLTFITRELRLKSAEKALTEVNDLYKKLHHLHSFLDKFSLFLREEHAENLPLKPKKNLTVYEPDSPTEPWRQAN